MTASKYALTEKEREWLDKRVSVCRYSNYSRYLRCHGCKYHAGRCLLHAPDYKGAAEFEAQVSRYIAENAGELNIVDGWSWGILREARIAVEEEMDNGND